MKVLRKQEIETANIQVGDQVIIPLAEIGEFSATAHKVTDEGIMFIFDEYITRRPMNSKNTNKGGFEKSELKKWMDMVLLMAFPEELRDKIYGLTLPTVGQIVGHEDEWDNNNLEPDTDEQLPLMKERKNRVAYFKNDSSWGWLRNATKEETSSAFFAGVTYDGSPNSYYASCSYGVRPEFWLTKEKPECLTSHDKKKLLFEFANMIMEETSYKSKNEKTKKITLYDELTKELKGLMDACVRAGFTRNESIHIVTEISKEIIGGGR